MHHTDVAQSMMPVPTTNWTGRSKTSMTNDVRRVVMIVVGIKSETGRTWKSILRLNHADIVSTL